MLPPYFGYLVFVLVLEPRIVHSQSFGVLPLVAVVAGRHDGHLLLPLTPGEAVIRRLTLPPSQQLFLDEQGSYLRRLLELCYKQSPKSGG